MTIPLRKLLEQILIERELCRRIDRIEPVLLIDEAAQHQPPTAIALFEEIVKAPGACLLYTSILHFGVRAQMLDQAAVDGGFEFGFLVGSHDLLRGLAMQKIETQPESFHSQSFHSRGAILATQSHELLESLFRTAVSACLLYTSRCV